jgi:hypothetical protein
MDTQEFDLLVPRAVGVAIRLRKNIDHFHSNLYSEDGKQKIGYGYDMDYGITEAVATTLIKSRLHHMGQALMRRAFETNLAGDPVRFGVFLDLAERVGEAPVLAEKEMWDAVKNKDYWKLHEAFFTSPLIAAYGGGTEGRRRIAYLAHVLVQGETAV